MIKVVLYSFICGGYIRIELFDYGYGPSDGCIYLVKRRFTKTDHAALELVDPEEDTKIEITIYG